MSKKAPPKKEEKPAAAPKEEAKPAAAAEEAPKSQKVEKAKHEKRHREEKGVHAIYKIEDNKVSRTRPACERCGAGYFMADHHDRYTCGHCGFTRYKQK